MSTLGAIALVAVALAFLALIWQYVLELADYECGPARPRVACASCGELCPVEQVRIKARLFPVNTPVPADTLRCWSCGHPFVVGVFVRARPPGFRRWLLGDWTRSDQTWDPTLGVPSDPGAEPKPPKRPTDYENEPPAGEA